MQLIILCGLHWSFFAIELQISLIQHQHSRIWLHPVPFSPRMKVVMQRPTQNDQIMLAVEDQGFVAEV